MQTNEDALCEEVQTDEITTRNKWTQKPVHISVGADNQLPGPQDYMGVGGDVDPVEFSAVPRKTANTGYLTTFLTSASQVIWTDVYPQFQRFTNTDDFKTTKSLTFSHNRIKREITEVTVTRDNFHHFTTKYNDPKLHIIL